MDFELYVDGIWFATLSNEVGMSLQVGDHVTIADKREMYHSAPAPIVGVEIIGRKLHLQRMRMVIDAVYRCKHCHGDHETCCTTPREEREY